MLYLLSLLSLPLRRTTTQIIGSKIKNYQIMHVIRLHHTDPYCGETT